MWPQSVTEHSLLDLPIISQPKAQHSFETGQYADQMASLHGCYVWSYTPKPWTQKSFSHNKANSMACPCQHISNLVLHWSCLLCGSVITYRKISEIRHSKHQNLNKSRLILQLPLPNTLKPGVKSRMKMWLVQRRQAMLQLHLNDKQFHFLLKCIL